MPKLVILEETHDKIAEISIIVPVYKVERYIEKCLESISQQTFKDWECIIVDDGSPDKSGEICDKFASKDNRFKIIHKENGGVSSARNTALNEAKGKYIAFIDPDDWAEPNYLEVLHGLIQKHNVDVVQCGFYREFTSFNKRKPLVNSEQILDRDTVLIGLLKNNNPPGYLWNKLFHREIVLERFPVGKNYEDLHTLPMWLSHIDKMVLSPELLYHYRMRKGSITKTGIVNNLLDYIDSCSHIAEKVYTLIPDKFLKKDYLHYIYHTHVEGAKTISRKVEDKALRNDFIQSVSDKLNKLDLPDIVILGLKLYFRSTLLRKNPGFFIKLMRGVNKFDFHAKRRALHLFE